MQALLRRRSLGLSVSVSLSLCSLSLSLSLSVSLCRSLCLSLSLSLCLSLAFAVLAISCSALACANVLEHATAVLALMATGSFHDVGKWVPLCGNTGPKLNPIFWTAFQRGGVTHSCAHHRIQNCNSWGRLLAKNVVVCREACTQ